jgi:diguanylate cyclase (GGDEF)-like protein
MVKRVRKRAKAAGSLDEMRAQPGPSEPEEPRLLRAPASPDPADAVSPTRDLPWQPWAVRGGAALLAVLLAVWVLSGEERLGTAGHLGLAVLLMIGCGSLGFLLGRRHQPAPSEAADIDALHRSTTQMLHSYSRDAPTGLDSRWSLERKLAEEIERSRRYGHPLGVIIIRFDRTFGPDGREQVGPSQLVLPAIGRAIRSSARKVDSTARYSHDSIAILTPETDRAGVESLAARSTNALARVSVRQEGKTFRPRLYVSYGVALFPEDGSTASQLLDVAEGESRQEQRLAA